jgi:general secretion pathway protein G
MRTSRFTSGSRLRRQGVREAFTLVEILIVVMILGILATIVIPQFTNAAHEARENTLKDDLRYLRTQIAVYNAQHRDRTPGFPGGDITQTPTAEVFVQQMTMFSDEDGAVNATKTNIFRFGPYLREMPKNPLNGSSAIRIVADDADLVFVDDGAGWVYNPYTHKIIANLPGNDASGTPYVNY